MSVNVVVRPNRPPEHSSGPGRSGPGTPPGIEGTKGVVPLVRRFGPSILHASDALAKGFGEVVSALHLRTGYQAQQQRVAFAGANFPDLGGIQAARLGRKVFDFGRLQLAEEPGRRSQLLQPADVADQIVEMRQRWLFGWSLQGVESTSPELVALQELVVGAMHKVIHSGAHAPVNCLAQAPVLSGGDS